MFNLLDKFKLNNNKENKKKTDKDCEYPHCTHKIEGTEGELKLCIFHLKEKDEDYFWEEFKILTDNYKENADASKHMLDCIGFHFPSMQRVTLLLMLHGIKLLNFMDAEFDQGLYLGGLKETQPEEQLYILHKLNILNALKITEKYHTLQKKGNESYITVLQILDHTANLIHEDSSISDSEIIKDLSKHIPEETIQEYKIIELAKELAKLFILQFDVIIFSRCIFHGYTNLFFTSVNRSAQFQYTKFLKNEDLHHPFSNYFQNFDCHELDFSNSLFEGESIFTDCIFSKELNFSACTFDSIGFLTAEFRDDVNFSVFTVKHLMVFIDSKYHQIDFTRNINEFYGAHITFQNIRALDHREGGNKEDTFENRHYIRFHQTSTWGIEFKNCDMNHVYLSHVNLTKASFSTINWERTKDEPYRIIIDHQLIKHQYKQCLKFLQKNENDNLLELLEEIDTHFQEKNQNTGQPTNINKDFIIKVMKDPMDKIRLLYLELQCKFEELHDFKLAGEFHYQATKIRQAILWHKNKSLSEWINWLVLFAYHLFAHYGENYKRVGIWMVTSIFVSAGMLTIFQEKKLPYWDNLHDIFFALIPKSLVNFQIKIEPFLSWEKGVVVVEATFFYTMLVLFIMSIRRQFKR